MEEPDASTQNGRAPEAAERRAAAIAAGCIVDISGVPVGLRASDQARGGALAGALGQLRADSGPPAAEISFGPRIPAMPDAAPDESYGGTFHVWRRGKDLYLAHATAVAGRVRVDRARFGGRPTPGFRHLMPLALGHMLGFAERFVLHAGVIERGGRVALIVGDSGTGKSTVTIAAREAGWRALSDDLAVVRVDGAGGRVQVTTLGLPLTFPGDLSETPLKGSRQVIGDARRRWSLPGPVPGKWRDVTGVIVPHHVAKPGGTLAEVAGGERFERAVSAFVAATEPLLLHRYVPAASALSRCRGWRLGLPPDPSDRLGAVAHLLEFVDAAMPPHTQASSR